MNIEKTLKRSISIWDTLSSQEQKMLTSTAIVKKFQPKEIIHRGHFDCSGLIIIESGSLRAYITSPNGKEVTLYHLYRDDICLFSASCLLKDINFEVEISSEQETICLLIPTSKYEEIISVSPLIYNFTNTILAKKFSSVMWLLEQIVFYSFDKRLADYLLDQTYNLDSHILNYTHEKIAKDLGTAREVVSRMLKYFEQEKLVTLKRNQISLINLEGLSHLTVKY